MRYQPQHGGDWTRLGGADHQGEGARDEPHDGPWTPGKDNLHKMVKKIKMFHSVKTNLKVISICYTYNFKVKLRKESYTFFYNFILFFTCYKA